MKKQIRELIDMMNGCEIVSDQYEGCVAVRGDRVLRYGAIIDTLDTDKKVMTLWNELVRQELGDLEVSDD